MVISPASSSANDDYRAVRAFLLKARDQMTDRGKKAAAQAQAWKHWFYPEYAKLRSVRDRFCMVATDHSTLKPTDPLQHSLFSLNGYFGFQEANSPAHTFSTCGLFVRACRAATRILEPELHDDSRLIRWQTNTPRGTDPCITGPGKTANIDYATRGLREPKSGDIFHVTNPDLTHDHVGIILSHQKAPNGDWIWKTAEGGQQPGGICTKSFDHVLTLKSGKHFLGSRPVLKWIDLDLLAASIPRA